MPTSRLLVRLSILALVLVGLFALVSEFPEAAWCAEPNTSSVEQRPAFSEFLFPDGAVDLDALRESGYEGPLDASGLRLFLKGPEDRPMFQLETQLPALAGENANWSDQFGESEEGTSYDVYALLMYGGDLIVGGSFAYAGSQPVFGIARWDGSTWSDMDGGMDGPVYALTEYNGELIAGGNFSVAGSAYASRIARWNGSAWSELSPCYTDYGPVYSLTVYQEHLIVGGGFRSIGGLTIGGIAKWDGLNWTPVSSSGANSTVRSLIVYGGDLIAGGTFTSIGGVNANRIARWDGTIWNPMGTGVNASLSTPEVYAMTVYGTDLVACGPFVTAGAVDANNVARWDGSEWHALGDGFNVGTRAVFVFNGELYVGGAFTAADGLPANDIARWDGTSWHALGDGMDSRVQAIAEYGGHLIAGGWFTKAGGQPAHYIAQWDGADWGPVGKLGQGMDYDVTCMAAYKGELIVGGGFFRAGSAFADGIAAWNGVEWHSLGPLEYTDASVYALTVWNDYLIVGGGFDTIGGVVASGIAKWDGTTWSAVSTEGTNGSVYALGVHDGDLIAGGKFTVVDGVSANRIARWDGAVWHPMGSGMAAGGFTPEVYGLAEFAGDLIAVGPFETAGGVTCNSVARWDGTAWHNLGAGFNIGSRAVAVYDDHLYVGGAFTASGATPINYVARWDGAVWQPVGLGTNQRVTCLTVHNKKLFAGGWFTQAGGTAANHVASWDGLAWNALASGTNGDVYALGSFESLLYVGGSFTTAGTKESLFIGSWMDSQPVPVKLLSFTAARTAVGALLRWEVADAFDHAGFHVFREGASAERAQLTEALLTGGPSFEFTDPNPPDEGARYLLAERTRSGQVNWYGPASLGPVDIAVRATALGAARPNPFKVSTLVSYTVSVPGPVTLEVYDVTGRRIALLTSGTQSAGIHEAYWNGVKNDGKRAAPGAYFIRLTTPNESANRRVILMQ